MSGESNPQFIADLLSLWKQYQAEFEGEKKIHRIYHPYKEFYKEQTFPDFLAWLEANNTKQTEDEDPAYKPGVF